ncbi:oligosaccharide flippase family protein [Scleromatobacter humisilvae]|uniref:Oligosaccharide flippase family protein n=1 Tax=Scleromatobacter humisilvae TaxID=2897159 RepID=A0A9X1YK69_9BURK|nr:oligosaccharide flippase family protein [Scleromatobacter humisilvae]MCK9685867.1 oligosaccharide flippase family protein [Scleromatobacter humisilvae]
MKSRVLRAGSWILGGQAVQQVLRLGTNVITAHLLFPDAFGLMSVVYMLATALALFSDLGVARTMVLSKRGSDPEFLDTAWSIQLVRSQVLALVICAAAGGLAITRHLGWWKAGTVYADERLPYLIVAFALTLVLQGFESIRIIQARRQMHLHTLTKIEISAQLASAVAMVLVAWTWHSIWALTAGAIVSGITRCILSYASLPGHKVRFRFDRDSAKELMGHAKWIILSSILTFMAVNGDRVLLGGLISVREFGLYSIAVIMASVLQNIANSVCNSIVFPALSEVYRERPKEFARNLERFQWGYDAMAVFPSAILITSAQTLIDLIYDTRYHDAGWMVMVLAAGIIGVRYQVVEVGYLAVAKTKYGAYANALRLMGLVAGLLIGRHYFGIVGTVAGVAMSQYAAWPLAIWFKKQVNALSWRAEAILVPAIVGGLLVGELLSMALRFAFPHHFAGR